MKKLLLAMTMLSLVGLSVSCNKSSTDKADTKATDVQREEDSMHMDDSDRPVDTMENKNMQNEEDRGFDNTAPVDEGDPINKAP